jgi:TRAP transporter TAXI family solute receptor
MKRTSIAILFIFVAGFVASPALAKTTFISVGTGGTGGIYYPYGGGVAEIWSKYVKGVKAVAEVTGASVENVKLAHKGETVVGEVMGDVAVAGFKGLSKFKGKKHDILSMAIMYPNLLQSRGPEKHRDHRYQPGERPQHQHGKPGKRHQFHGRSGA